MGIVVCLSLLLLSGCSDHGLESVSLQDAHIERAIAVVYLTPQIDDYHSGDSSHFAVIYPDGSYRFAKAEQMDMGFVDWTVNGLFYAGNNHDTWVHAGKVSKIASVKMPIDYRHHLAQEDVLLPIDNGKSYVTFINGGFQNQKKLQGYNEQYIYTDHKQVHQFKWSSESNVNSASACGHNVYIFQQIRDPQTGRLKTLVRMINIFKRFHPIKVAEYSSFLDEEAIGSPVSPCTADKITSITNHSLQGDEDMPDDLPPRIKAAAVGKKIDGYTVPVLNVFDMAKRKYRITPLLLKNGQSLPISIQDAGNPLYDQNALQNKSLYWATMSGSLFQTDIHTGVTRCITKMPIHKYRDPDVHVKFFPGYAIVYENPNDDKHYDVTLQKIDLKTGKAEKTIVVKRLARHFSMESVDRDFAPNPTSSFWK